MKDKQPVKLKKNIAILQQFVMADRPNWMKPVDHEIIQTLLKYSDSKNMTTYMSVQSIAEEINSSPSTVQRSLKKMQVFPVHKKPNPKGLVTKQSGKGKFDPNLWAVQITALHLGRQFTRTALSADAYNIVQRYFELLRSLPKHQSKKNPTRMYMAYRSNPNHKQRWELLAQDWLDAGYTKEQIDVLVDAAFRLYPDTARHGMHTLRSKLSRLCKEAGVEIGKPLPKKQTELPMEEQ